MSFCLMILAFLFLIESEIEKISKKSIDKASSFIILNYIYYDSYVFVSVFIYILEWLWLEGRGFLLDTG